LSGAALLIAGGLSPRAQAAAQPERYYPPALTGLRVSHPGSFEVAHQVGREGQRFDNSDAGWNAYTHEAIEQAWRAVQELKMA